jgi:hypothetical protein
MPSRRPIRAGYAADIWVAMPWRPVEYDEQVLGRWKNLKGTDRQLIVVVAKSAAFSDIFEQNFCGDGHREAFRGINSAKAAGGCRIAKVTLA